ncbi:MAG: prepilin-type N-terminal cleavage/methylation domain-containing protein [Patescibacteria group bacterium]
MKRYFPKGFTLLEVVITASILAAVATLAATLASTGFQNWDRNREQVESQESARTALTRISKLIREAQPADNGSYTIAAAAAQTITFYADADNDGGHEQVRLFLQGTQLKMGIIKPAGSPVSYPVGNETVQTLVSGIQNGGAPVFTYYDGNFTGTQAPLTLPITIQNVRLVHIALIIDADPTKIPTAITVETNMAFRNLKDNL